VPHFFTPIIIACGRFFEFVTSEEDDNDIIVDKIQTIDSTKTIPLRQLKIDKTTLDRHPNDSLTSN